MSELAGVESFSTLPNYFKSRGTEKLCFVDTTVLFAETYPLDAFHDETVVVFDLLSKAGVSVFTNVNVRAEFLENHRRVLIAECLIDLLEDQGSELDGLLVEKLKAHRTSFRRKVSEQKSAKIDIQQIKMFMHLLKSHRGKSGDAWEFFCRDRLLGQMERIWDMAEEELGLNFISLRSDYSSPFLNQIPDWRDATVLIGKYGIASADAMILNMFLCSKIPVLLTADLEMAEVASKESKVAKKIFVPDSTLA
ncbi:MAG: hypothetical protein WCH11_01050 [Bdellovibrio sp.]